MRPSSRSERLAAPCSGPSTSSARSSTCSSRHGGTERPHGGSSPERWAGPGSHQWKVTTDRYRVYPRVLGELLPAAFHDTEVNANNRIETDHGRLKARLRPMRGLKRDRTARVIVAAHGFVQNARRGFYDLGIDVPPATRLVEVFDEPALVI
jgi:DDE domain